MGAKCTSHDIGLPCLSVSEIQNIWFLCIQSKYYTEYFNTI
jgi:hypothetical protein